MTLEQKNQLMIDQLNLMDNFDIDMEKVVNCRWSQAIADVIYDEFINSLVIKLPGVVREITVNCSFYDDSLGKPFEPEPELKPHEKALHKSMLFHD